MINNQAKEGQKQYDIALKKLDALYKKKTALAKLDQQSPLYAVQKKAVENAESDYRSHVQKNFNNVPVYRKQVELPRIEAQKKEELDAVKKEQNLRSVNAQKKKREEEYNAILKEQLVLRLYIKMLVTASKMLRLLPTVSYRQWLRLM